MTVSYPETSMSNPYIVTLERLLRTSPDEVDWLVIAHTDLRMVRTLGEALSGKSAVILRISQDEWNVEQLLEAISWGMAHAPIRHLVVAGCARSPYQSVSATGSESTEAGEAASGYDRLIDGAVRYRYQLRESRCRFVKHVEQLAQAAEISGRTATGALNLHPLLYQSDGGTFMFYNIHDGSFSMLSPAPDTSDSP